MPTKPQTNFGEYSDFSSPFRWIPQHQYQPATPNPRTAPKKAPPRNMLMKRQYRQKTRSEVSQENKALQRDLQSLGLYKGRIDGIIGPKSMEAIRAAEEKGYIVTDGKVVKHWIPKKKTAQQKAQNAKPTEELNKNLSWWQQSRKIHRDDIDRIAKEKEATISNVARTAFTGKATLLSYIIGNIDGPEKDLFLNDVFIGNVLRNFRKSDEIQGIERITGTGDYTDLDGRKHWGNTRDGHKLYNASQEKLIKEESIKALERKYPNWRERVAKGETLTAGVTGSQYAKDKKGNNVYGRLDVTTTGDSDRDVVQHSLGGWSVKADKKGIHIDDAFDFNTSLAPTVGNMKEIANSLANENARAVANKAIDLSFKGKPDTYKLNRNDPAVLKVLSIIAASIGNPYAGARLVGSLFGSPEDEHGKSQPGAQHIIMDFPL